METEKTLPKKKRKWLWVVIPLVLVCAIAVPVWVFLDSIHYQLWEYMTFRLGPDPIDSFTDFDTYQDKLELIAEEVLAFVEETPDFFERFTGLCRVTEDGLEFSSQKPSEGYLLQEVTTPGWETVGDYGKAFPRDMNNLNIRVEERYPGYVQFRPELKARVLVYTGGEKPNDLIDTYWNRFDFVRVKKLAKGWYDLCP